MTPANDELGVIAPFDALFPHRLMVGGVQDIRNGQTYEFVLVNGAIPGVQSMKTGKYFLLPYTEILGLALDAGIDEEDV